MIPHQNISTNETLKPGTLALFLLAGFLPVSSIVLHCIGIVPLQICLLTMIIPLFSYIFIQGFRLPSVGRTALNGWLAGILAVLLYDLSRIPFMMMGWGDFIPKIGAWLSNTPDPDFMIGYAWRYIGNGGGMGIAFFMLLRYFDIHKNLVWKGVLYGLFIFTSLMIILCLFEEAQRMMFKITPLSFAGSLTGHVVYGFVLGIMARRNVSVI